MHRIHEHGKAGHLYVGLRIALQIDTRKFGYSPWKMTEYTSEAVGNFSKAELVSWQGRRRLELCSQHPDRHKQRQLLRAHLQKSCVEDDIQLG